MTNLMNIVNKCLGKGISYNRISRDRRSRNMSSVGSAFGGGPSYSGNLMTQHQQPILLQAQQQPKVDISYSYTPNFNQMRMNTPTLTRQNVSNVPQINQTSPQGQMAKYLGVNQSIIDKYATVGGKATIINADGSVRGQIQPQKKKFWGIFG